MSSSTSTRASLAHAGTLTPAQVRAWLNDGQELAFLDVREAGQFGEGHPFLAVSLPYSRLELDTPRLVPRLDTRTVLLDDGDGVAARAAHRLALLGYTDLHLLQGGAPGWAAAGYTLFKGVNLPSKTFGERVEQVFGTPHISAAALQEKLASGEPLLLLDGRTLEEHHKMTIPGAIPVPNGELATRWRELAPDPATPIVVHCAGRTRSIIGAQILRSLGVPNPVIALENGTQGWALSGFALERGSTRQINTPLRTAHSERLDRDDAAREAERSGAPLLSAGQAQAWLDDATRTTYLLDVRTAGEFAAGSLSGARHAPGGQLLQAADQSIGVRRSRVILLDDDAVRAPVIAAWLRRLGVEAATVEAGIHAPLASAPAPALVGLTGLPRESSADLAAWAAQSSPVLLDLQPSRDYRRQHASGARWSVRPRVVADALAASAGKNTRAVLLLVSDGDIARLAAADLRDAGFADVRWALTDDWAATGLPVERTPELPTDADAIDYLLFVHDRHEGNLDAARRYLEWETGLIAQCAPDELAVFDLPAPADAPTSAHPH